MWDVGFYGSSRVALLGGRLYRRDRSLMAGRVIWWGDVLCVRGLGEGLRFASVWVVWVMYVLELV